MSLKLLLWTCVTVHKLVVRTEVFTSLMHWECLQQEHMVLLKLNGTQRWFSSGWVWEDWNVHIMTTVSFLSCISCGFPDDRHLTSSFQSQWSKYSLSTRLESSVKDHSDPLLLLIQLILTLTGSVMMFVDRRVSCGGVGHSFRSHQIILFSSRIRISYRALIITESKLQTFRTGT